MCEKREIFKLLVMVVAYYRALMSCTNELVVFVTVCRLYEYVLCFYMHMCSAVSVYRGV
jgi:hypothetical protein